MPPVQEIDVLCPIERVEETDSTQRLARGLVASGELGARARLVVAERQTAGVGRFGRAWSSPDGGLWCTLAWPLTASAHKAREGLGLRAGLAVAESVEHLLAAHGHGEAVRIKWPNDILVEDKKLAGVLCEIIDDNQGRPYALVGAGVNANFPVSALPAELQAGATTLQDLIGRDANLGRLLTDLRRRLCDTLASPGLHASELAKIAQRLHNTGRRVRVTLADKSTREGLLLGLTPDGRLRLETSEGEWTAPPGAELASV